MLIRFSLLCLLSINAFAQCEVVDADLTKGAPKDKRFTIKGGAWERGWRVAGELDQIVIDAGYDIRNGYFEAVVTRQGGIAFPERKRNWMAALACAEGHQCPGGMARGGSEGYGFSKAEIFSAKQTNTICEKKFGEASDWMLDDKTEHTVRAEIRNGVMTWTNKVGEKSGQSSCGGEAQPVTHLYLPDGSKQACRTQGKLGNDVLIAGLRYAWLGGIDEELKLAFPGMRFLRARLVDLDKQQ